MIPCYLLPSVRFASYRPREYHGRSNTRKAKGAIFSLAETPKRSFWVLPKTKGALTAALEGNISEFMFLNPDHSLQWSSLGQFESLCIDKDGRFPGGRLASISSAEDVDNITKIAGTSDIIVMDSHDWKAIPAENLIAAFQSTATKLYAMVESVDEARAMFSMLQAGVHGCVLRSGDEREVAAFAALKRELVDQVGQPVPHISTATIKGIRTIGVGERVCVDTCSLLKEDEGMLVGSSSQAMFLVLSEAAQSDYVASRPFRVNAGPVHSYCLVPGGKTKYLAELRAGDEVLIVGSGGKTSRAAVVGRSKIETRPLILIDAENEDGTPCSVFVQNAETVRLAAVATDGHIIPTSVTSLEVNDHLLLKTDNMARHVGIAIDEDLLEK